MMRSRPSTVLHLTALLTVFTAVAAHAATITWSNSAGGAWSTAANWSPATVPGSGDHAVLPALSGAYSVTLDVNPSAAQLDIAAGDPTLDMNGKSIASVGVIENSGTIANFAGAYTAAQMHNHTGGFVIGAYDGVITMAGGSLITNDGTIVVGPGSSSQLYTSGSVSINGSGTLKLDHTKIIDSAGLPQTTAWLTIGADQTLRGSGLVEKKLWNNGTWIADSDDGTLQVHAVAYNRGTVVIQNGGTLYVNSPLFQNENSGIIRTGAGGGTLDLRISEDGGATRNGNVGSVDLLRGGAIVIADGGDLNLHAGQLFGGPISREGDAGVLNMDGTSLQQMSIEAGAEVLSTGWLNQQIQEHVRIDGLLRIAGQFMCGLADTSVHDTTWFSGSGVVQLEDGILGLGNTARVLVNEVTIRGHGTINPPFQNNGTVDLDAVRLARPGRLMNTGVMKIGTGGMIATGPGTVLSNTGRLQIAGVSRLERAAGIDNRGGVITVDRSTFALGNSSTIGTITGGRLESANGGTYQVARGGTLRDVTLGSTGVLNVGANATLVAAGSRFTNLGTVNVAAAGRVSTDGTTQYLQTRGATALAGGTLLSARDVQIQAGALRGFGLVSANLVNRGTVAPDAGAGALRIAGNYSQLTGGTLQCSLAGPATSQTSHFEVTGTAALAGSLSPVLVDGYVPGAGQSFPVFTYGALTGNFDPLAVAAGSLNSATTFTPYFQDGAMTLVAGGTTAVGDGPSAIGTLRFFGSTTRAGTSFVLQLPYAAELKGRLYDAAGREVAKLADGVLPAGAHTFSLGRVADGSLASGVYFARMSVVHDGITDLRIARAVVLR